jgi:PIN domain nuclease of toxin-antitoxin system
VIVLDTHVWVWWVHGDPQLPPDHQAYIQANEAQGLGVCAISCWEVAKLVERGQHRAACLRWRVPPTAVQ